MAERGGALVGGGMSIRRNQAPDVSGLLRNYVSRYADAWAHAHHHGDPRAGEWIRLAVQTLRSEHPAGARWVLNGKRGNPNDASWDIVGYVVDEANGNPRMIECYDVIGGAGGPSPSIYWGNVTNYDTMGQDGTAIAIDPPPLAGGGVPAPPSAGATWTAAHAAVLAKLPDYAGTLMIAEQMAHSFPEDEWGQKSRGTGEISADTIGRKTSGRFLAYRVIPRGGAPAEYDLTNDSSQKFHEVRAENHLGDEPTPIPQPPAPTPPSPEPLPSPAPVPPSADMAAVLADIRTSQHAIAAALLDQSRRLGAIEAQIAKVGARKFPTYTARVFGQETTFKPKEEKPS